MVSPTLPIRFLELYTLHRESLELILDTRELFNPAYLTRANESRPLMVQNPCG